MRVYQFRHFGRQQSQGLTTPVLFPIASMVQLWCTSAPPHHECHPHPREAQPMATIIRRPRPNGQTSYRAQVRRKGAPSLSATFTKLSDAKKWIQVTEAAIVEGRHFKTAEAKRHTLADLIDRCVESILPQKSHSSIYM